jgi:hypothetical protein
MPINRHLEPGQYQIGEFIFGRYTLFPVEQFDIGGYDVNVQDYQSQSSDELRFGSDTLKPMPIQMTLNALQNFSLPNVIAHLNNPPAELNYDDDRVIGRFIREWRADPVRTKWGELKYLLCCRKDGRVIRVYGRPGKLAVTKLPTHGSVQKLVCEFRRSDTLAYNDFEWFVNLPPDDVLVIPRAEEQGRGDGPSWLRFLLFGPMIHPIIQLGTMTIDLDAEIEAGQVVEISSYPWERRVIRLNDGLSLSASLTSPYLDKLYFYPNTAIELSWNATSILTTENKVDFSTDGFNTTTVWYPVVYSGPGAGTMGLSSGQLKWTDSGNQVRLGTTVTRTPTVTDYQSIKFQLATPAEHSIAEEPCANRAIGRSNAAMTEYVYWDITTYSIQYGYRMGGVDYPLSPKIDYHHIILSLKRILDAAQHFDLFGLISPDNDWEYEVDFGTGAGLLTSSMSINGCYIATFEGSPQDNSVVDANHRLTGVGMRATQRLTGQSTPGPFRYVQVRDNPPEDVAAEVDTQSQVLMLWRDAWQSI